LNIACVPKKVPAFLRAESGNDATDPAQEMLNGSLGSLAQMRRRLAKTGICGERIYG
jgi:hypothetical protein